MIFLPAQFNGDNLIITLSLIILSFVVINGLAIYFLIIGDKDLFGDYLYNYQLYRNWILLIQWLIFNAIIATTLSLLMSPQIAISNPIWMMGLVSSIIGLIVSSAGAIIILIVLFDYFPTLIANHKIKKITRKLQSSSLINRVWNPTTDWQIQTSKFRISDRIRNYRNKIYYQINLTSKLIPNRFITINYYQLQTQWLTYKQFYKSIYQFEQVLYLRYYYLINQYHHHIFFNVYQNQIGVVIKFNYERIDFVFSHSQFFKTDFNQNVNCRLKRNTLF